MKNSNTDSALAKMTEKYNLIVTELETTKMKYSNTENALAKAQLEITETKITGELYLECAKTLYNDVDQLSSDSHIIMIITENNNTSNKLVQYLQSIFYNHKKWEETYNAKKSTFDKIQKLYPEFSEHEFQIVCLKYLNYSDSMIASVINLKKSSVQQTKSTIRSKLKIVKGGSIAIFIKNQLKPD
jgi:hypothetical protein